jgi:hypothetical protein
VIGNLPFSEVYGCALLTARDGNLSSSGLKTFLITVIGQAGLPVCSLALCLLPQAA